MQEFNIIKSIHKLAAVIDIHPLQILQITHKKTTCRVSTALKSPLLPAQLTHDPRETAGFFGGLGDALDKTVSGVSGTVGTTVSGLGKTVGGATQGLGQAVSGASEGLGNTAKGVGKSAGGALGSIGKKDSQGPYSKS